MSEQPSVPPLLPRRVSEIQTPLRSKFGKLEPVGQTIRDVVPIN